MRWIHVILYFYFETSQNLTSIILNSIEQLIQNSNKVQQHLKLRRIYFLNLSKEDTGWYSGHHYNDPIMIIFKFFSLFCPQPRLKLKHKSKPMESKQCSSSGPLLIFLLYEKNIRHLEKRNIYFWIVLHKDFYPKSHLCLKSKEFKVLFSTKNLEDTLCCNNGPPLRFDNQLGGVNSFCSSCLLTLIHMPDYY